jgi:hypothetical protein
MSLTNVLLQKRKHGVARNNGCIAISEMGAFLRQTKTRNLPNKPQFRTVRHPEHQAVLRDVQLEDGGEIMGIGKARVACGLKASL